MFMMVNTIVMFIITIVFTIINISMNARMSEEILKTSWGRAMPSSNPVELNRNMLFLDVTLKIMSLSYLR